MPNVVIKAIWLALMVLALVLMIRGLWATVYFEPTHEAIAEERRGKLLVFVACVILVGSAVLATQVLSAPGWATAALVAPVVICGGLVVTPVVVPILGVLVAYPITAVGIVAVLAARDDGS